MNYAPLRCTVILFSLLFGFKESFGQRFTSNQNGNWLTAGIWTRDNPNACAALRNAPPSTNDYAVNCRVDVLINHEVFFNSTNTFGGGYFGSLTVNGPSGNLIFQQNLDFNTGGSSLPAPNNVVFNVNNGGQINVPNGQITVNRAGVINITGNSTVIANNLVMSSNNATINVEAGSRLIIRNTTTLNSNTILNIFGEFVTNDLTFSSGGTLNADGSSQVRVRNNVALGNGIFNATNQSDIRVGGNFNMSGGGVFNAFNDSYIQVSGQLNKSTNAVNLTNNSRFIVDGTRSGAVAGISINQNACYQASNDPNNCLIEPGSPCSTQTSINSGQEVVVIFYCNGSWSAPENLTEYQILVAGGGGAGGRTNSGNANKAGGGGGGGAVVLQIIDVPTGIPANASFPITIGSGGNGAATLATDRNGQASTFSNGSIIITAGGGGGGGRSDVQVGLVGANGSSGGGAGAQSNGNSGSGGSGNGAGNSGGNSSSSGNSSNQFGGGGGGANGSGIVGTGGAGIVNSISGFPTFYGSGGGGGTGGTGITGIGGGNAGNGGNGSTVAQGGVPNTGGGGGGAGGNNRVGGNGGSGIVVIRYALAKILPVEFFSFSADFLESSRNIQLNWITLKEWNNSHFEIQRSVDYAKTWENIGLVNGAGWSDIPSEYFFTDKNLPLAGGLVYYRLRQEDFDGQFSFSKTISVKVPAVLNKGNSWRVFPNPYKGGSIFLESLSPDLEKGEIIETKLVAFSGQVLGSLHGNLIEVNDWLNEIIERANPGMYILEINQQKNLEYLKIFK